MPKFKQNYIPRRTSKRRQQTANLSAEAVPHSDDLVLVPGQNDTPQNGVNPSVFNNLLVIVLPKPSRISNLQKAWGRVGKRKIHPKSNPAAKRTPKISNVISIDYKPKASAGRVPSAWNNSAIRHVPYPGVRPRSS
jgi:hypothetical protein